MTLTPVSVLPAVGDPMVAPVRVTVYIAAAAPALPTAMVKLVVLTVVVAAKVLAAPANVTPMEPAM